MARRYHSRSRGSKSIDFQRPRLERNEGVVEKEEPADDRTVVAALDALHRETAPRWSFKSLRGHPAVAYRSHEKELPVIRSHENRRHVRIEAQSLGQCSQRLQPLVEALARQRVRFRGRCPPGSGPAGRARRCSTGRCGSCDRRGRWSRGSRCGGFRGERNDQSQTEDQEEGDEDRPSSDRGGSAWGHDRPPSSRGHA